ncbi:TROVE domain-containing protein [Deltaproteobacteria bacterium Smac51]|nr:TROVE domain-containing protein [Deltaproteobacteria bacterium Smac51]
MRINFKKLFRPKTHEGAPAAVITAEMELRRTIMACLLWEDNFYESGGDVAGRIRELVARCQPETVAALAIEAREKGRLRHAPLLLMRELARHEKKPKIAADLARVIQRADELAEFLALYWSEGRCPLSAQVKKGLAEAFGKFDGYQLAKYNRDGAVRLRDVLFLCHPKPKDGAQEELWKELAEKRLNAPDTWEVGLSAGGDKKAVFSRLLQEKKLGYLALLRNLRNMVEAGVDNGLIRSALRAGAEKSKALPFRFVAAARAVPSLEPELDKAMKQAVMGLPRLSGRTYVLVDVSGSMDDRLSRKSDLNRLDAAAALAVLVCAVAERARVFTFSNRVVEVPPRRSISLIEAVRQSQPHGGTELGKAVKHLKEMGGYDRLIVVTDEQSHDRLPGPGGRGYMINVANCRNGVGYGDWVHIDGFSEAVINYIQALESLGK